jgi:hypothetical protein
VLIYYGQPTYTLYVLGQLLFNTADSKIYRRGASGWVKSADPADIIAGTIAAGVILGGTMDLTVNGIRTQIANVVESWNGTTYAGFKMTRTSDSQRLMILPDGLVVMKVSGSPAVDHVLLAVTTTGIFLGDKQLLGTRGAAVNQASGGSVVDVEARAAINALIQRLSASYVGGHGLIA